MTADGRDPAAAPEAPTTVQPAATPATPVVEPVPVAAACPRCGAPLREDQEWCLNCGAAATTRVAAPAGWRTPMAIVAGVLAIAVVVIGLAFLVVTDDTDELTKIAQNPTPAATPAAPTPAPTVTPVPSPAPGEAGADPAATVPPATGGEQPALEGEGDGDGDGVTPVPSAAPTTTPDAGTSDPITSPDTGSSGSVGSWPDGRTAFTVVLLSSPTKSGADRKARQLASGGTEVGVLKSDDYSSLRRGFWVVFSGQYGSRDSAERALEGLQDEASGAYVRRVVPR